jgi:hypothetical protein
MTDETPLLRIVSKDNGVYLKDFTDAVRARDRCCVISGDRPELERRGWSGFDAVHIFPIAQATYWQKHRFDQWITISPTEGGTINSAQNGLLLRTDLGLMFDDNELSINPDV